MMPTTVHFTEVCSHTHAYACAHVHTSYKGEGEESHGTFLKQLCLNVKECLIMNSFFISQWRRKGRHF